MTIRVDAGAVLGGLKDFQRATVEHACSRLFDDGPDATHRFLVADEVGLGKTLVARGVVAKTIERLRHDVQRIDIVYICANRDIADQNVRKLDIANTGTGIASRLTLLANQVQDLRSRRLNIVALTPGTSFERSSATGLAEERVLLYWLLREVWELGRGWAPQNVLQATSSKRRFREHINWFDRSRIDPGIAEQFAQALDQRCEEERRHGHPTIRERFDELCDEFRWSGWHRSLDIRRMRDALVSELRGLLAASCVEVLEPDLVILDEFQRFKHLLDDDPESEAASLAQRLFNWHRPETGERARTLLLSATPYRALTVAGDGGEDDHHEDFLATVRFLAGSDERVDELRALLRDYQSALYAMADDGPERVKEVAEEIESLLSMHIARTERIGAAGRQDAMLRHVVRTSAPRVRDLRQYLLAQDLADHLDQPDVTELWKSAPYLLNFLDGYKLRTRFDAECRSEDGAPVLAELLRGADGLMLDRGRLRAYEDVDPGNARLRELVADVIDSEAWRMLWIPPALPYHQLGGAYARPELRSFTKRLVFSAWRAVPRSVAGLLSFLAERRLVLAVDPQAVNTTERRSAQRNRLAFAVDPGGRRTGMPALALLYPSPVLAETADPRDFAAEHRDGSPEDALDWARTRIAPLLGPLVAGTPVDGEPDRRWYWAAPLLLDRDRSRGWWDIGDLAARWTGGDPRASADGHWAEHVDTARATAAGSLDPALGRPPDDLIDVLALMALGAPGTVALRALCRVTDLAQNDLDVRLAAARVAWGLRALFNSPEATALLRATRTETYWQEVLRHAVNGDLQAVLDEHAHMLRESECSADASPVDVADLIADAMGRALGLRASRVTYTHIDASNGEVSTSTERLHTAYSMRFGDEEGADGNDSQRARAVQLREAFNSPYWPFVLVSTSVGQEGLDFHPYCHVVVHWNLPTNPVDLEQREGRVHRYKNHAVRKNVALRHGRRALATDGDPWKAAFELVADDRRPDDTELVPYWIYPAEDGAAVERQVLALPLSRELDRLETLRNSLAVYRLAFGQARQEDVIDYLLKRLGPERAARMAGEVRIDLRPPVVGEAE